MQCMYELLLLWGFPKLRGIFLEVPIIRIIVFWGLYWGPLILGNYHIISGTSASACHLIQETVLSAFSLGALDACAPVP